MYSAYRPYRINPVGPSPADAEPRSVTRTREELSTSGGKSAFTWGSLPGVLKNSDGDRAEVSGKAMDLWRELAGGNSASPASPASPALPASPASPQTPSLPSDGIAKASDYQLDLPSPFLDWEQIINGSPDLLNYQNGPVAGSMLPPIADSALPPATDPMLPPVADSSIPSDQALPYTAASIPGGAPAAGAPSEKTMPDIAPDSTEFNPIEPHGKCETCESRRYVDRSDDSSVSYQTPTKISANMSGAAVASHENEHVRNERGKAMREDREIVNQSVTFKYATCPECGKQYVAGGTTHTTSVSKPKPDNKPEEAQPGASA